MSHGELDSEEFSFINPVDFVESGNKSMRYSFESERGGKMNKSE